MKHSSRQGSRLRLWVPIQVDPSWFVVLGLVTWSLGHGYFPLVYPGFPVPVYWVMGLLSALLLFACVLLHELGHSLAAQASGIPVARVTLFMFGGMAQITGEPSRPGMELKIALAGPIVSVALAALCYGVMRLMPVQNAWQLAVWAVLRYLVVINIGVTVFNMLPGFPLDGGRILRALVWAWTGQVPLATRIASQVGQLLGWALLGWGLWLIARGGWIRGVWYVLLGSFLRNAAWSSYRRASR